MNCRPGLLLVRVVTASPRMSNKTKAPSHYDTLEVNQRATQSEIKAAYFKLSKEYHPDINPSEAATSKFRNIAEAYEVLGSFSSRKAYDRSILTHTKYAASQPRSTGADPKMKEYQAQAAIFRTSMKSGSVPKYDFDAWTKAHYGQTLERTLKDRGQGARRKAARMENSTQPMSSSGATFLGVILSLGIFFVMATWRQIDYDYPSLNMQDQRDKEKTSLSSESVPVEAPTVSASTK